MNLALETQVKLLRMAAESGSYDGRLDTPFQKRYFRRCRVQVPLGLMRFVTMIFTRDTGHHSSGWWKNPDYERCYHLSVSFQTVDGYAPFDKRVAWEIARMFFGDDVKKAWVEPPYSELGVLAGVYHYRVFCDLGWQAIEPRGEVYSKEFTERGWKSFSELHADREDPLHESTHAEGPA